MTMPELRQLRAALTYDDQAIARDLPDLVSFLMATAVIPGSPWRLARPVEHAGRSARGLHELGLRSSDAGQWTALASGGRLR
jgi:hypothetical protein